MPKTYISWKSIWIYLKSQIKFWNLKIENLIQMWKSFIPSENLFQIWILQSGAMCVYSSLLRDKFEYTHLAPLRWVQVWNRFSDGINLFRFRLNFQISKLNLRFQINSNGFTRHRSFGQRPNVNIYMHTWSKIWIPLF